MIVLLQLVAQRVVPQDVQTVVVKRVAQTALQVVKLVMLIARMMRAGLLVLADAITAVPALVMVLVVPAVRIVVVPAVKVIVKASVVAVAPHVQVVVRDVREHALMLALVAALLAQKAVPDVQAVVLPAQIIAPAVLAVAVAVLRVLMVAPAVVAAVLHVLMAVPVVTDVPAVVPEAVITVVPANVRAVRATVQALVPQSV